MITNGFFSRDEGKIDDTARALCQAGVNDVLLSADVFHQEFITLEPVMLFACALRKHGVPSLRIQPAWLVSEAHENPYNIETKRLIGLFADLGITANQGNVIFPSGSALKHLSEWFQKPEQVDLTVPCGSEPYTDRPDAADCICINPNSDVALCSLIIGNIHRQDAFEILAQYDPYKIPEARAVLEGGVTGLCAYARTLGLFMDLSDCRSACGVCRKIMDAIRNKAQTG